MAKLTVKQLYYGDEYGVMGQVIKSLLQNPPPTVTIDPNTYRELEIVRQTLIAVEKMKKNGDRIPSSSSAIQSPFFFICSIAITV